MFITDGCRGHTRSPAALLQCPSTSSVALHDYVSGSLRFQSRWTFFIRHSKLRYGTSYGCKMLGAEVLDTERMLMRNKMTNCGVDCTQHSLDCLATSVAVRLFCNAVTRLVEALRYKSEVSRVRLRMVSFEFSSLK